MQLDCTQVCLTSGLFDLRSVCVALSHTSTVAMLTDLPRACSRLELQKSEQILERCSGGMC
jgi:hypothetical protein